MEVEVRYQVTDQVLEREFAKTGEVGDRERTTTLNLSTLPENERVEWAPFVVHGAKHITLSPPDSVSVRSTDKYGSSQRMTAKVPVSQFDGEPSHEEVLRYAREALEEAKNRQEKEDLRVETCKAVADALGAEVRECHSRGSETWKINISIEDLPHDKQAVLERLGLEPVGVVPHRESEPSE